MALYVVTGPPASGKTTWVQQRAKVGDIVIDYDVLAVALSVPGSDLHHHQRHVKATAFRARSAAISEALKHITACDVYVIHTLPKPEHLERYAEHSAHVVTIDPGRDVVMARIAEQRHHTARAVAARWYASRRDRDGDHVDASGSRSW